MRACDVLVVGAGPTGLVLALWLTKLGARARIVDKTAEPGTTSRALHPARRGRAPMRSSSRRPAKIPRRASSLGTARRSTRATGRTRRSPGARGSTGER